MFSLWAEVSACAGILLLRRPLELGGPLTHLGVGLMALGILASTAYDRTELIELPPGGKQCAKGELGTCVAGV